MSKTLDPIRPGIVTASGETIYPTGDEWLFFFAIKGCAWAEKALQEKEAALRKQRLREGEECVC